MKKSLLLTRGEVDKILRQALRTRGALPEVSGTPLDAYMSDLAVANVVARAPVGTPWNDCPAVLFTWTEEVPDEPTSILHACTNNCAAKPGSPLLCPSCLARQNAGLSNSEQSS